MHVGRQRLERIALGLVRAGGDQRDLDAPCSSCLEKSACMLTTPIDPAAPPSGITICRAAEASR
jgi:hypothetical protein